ncbi:MAG: 2-phosphosulfolactate phosphatase [Bacteroidota bacterium]
MKTVEVCLTPDLIQHFSLKGKVVIVVDIFRATSCIVTGLAYGVNAIYPVATVEECKAFKKKGMIIAGERGGQKVEGFDVGNSPYEYMNVEFQGKDIGVTTTNGTQAIIKSIGADEILIGAFLNLRALADYVLDINKNIIIHCAGWKGMVNIEDTLFAGALINEIKAANQPSGDSAFMAQDLFHFHQTDLLNASHNSSHAKRLAAFGIEKDLDFCMEMSLYSIIPIFKDKKITLL